VSDWQQLSRKLRIFNWISLLILAVASCLSMAPSFTLGLVLGGIISIANFAVLSRSVISAFGAFGVSKASKVAIVFKYYLRLAAMGILICVLIGSSWVSPVGLAFGLSIVVLNIIVLGISKACNLSSREAT
jgi:hypothetical protein